MVDVGQVTAERDSLRRQLSLMTEERDFWRNSSRVWEQWTAAWRTHSVAWAALALAIGMLIPSFGEWRTYAAFLPIAVAVYFERKAEKRRPKP